MQLSQELRLGQRRLDGCLEEQRGGVEREGEDAEIVIGVRMVGTLGENGAIEGLGLKEPVGVLQFDRPLEQCVQRGRGGRSFETLGHSEDSRRVFPRAKLQSVRRWGAAGRGSVPADED